MGVVSIDSFLSERDLSVAAAHRHYRYKLGLLDRYLAGRQIDLAVLAQYPGWLRSRGYADASIQSIVAAARAYVRWAVDRGLLGADCLRWRPRLAMVIGLPKAIKDDDAERLIAAASSPRDRALLLLLRDTGARIGSLLSIDVDDVDMGRRRIVTRAKGGGLVMLFLSQRCCDALREYLGGRSDGPLFLGRSGRLTISGARRLIHRLAQREGVIGRVNPHAWRHAFARRCVRAGLDLSRTARLMGHRSVTVTARYYAVWDGDELAQAHAFVTGM